MSHGFGAALKVEDGKPRLPGNLHTNRRLSQWLAIHPDGRVTITPGKVELGQGILTTLSQIAADELDVDFARVTARPAATPDSPDEAVTSGSLSTQDSGSALRHVCAAARMIFLGVVAQRVGVPLETIRIEDGRFIGPAGEIGSYWALADQALLECEAPIAVTAKAPGARRIAGTSVPRIDLPDKVFGAARYVHDLRLPGMLHARVVRPPARGAALAALREGPLPGDARLVRDGNFLAVLASTEWDAEAAAARLAARAEWAATDTLPEQALLAGWLRAAATRGERSAVASRADPAPAAARTLRRSFTRPYLAHGSIAPSCAVARWEGDGVEVFTHSQGPYNLRADLAKALKCPPEKIVVRHREGPAATATTAPTTWRWMRCWSPARRPACRFGCSGPGWRSWAGRPSPRPCWWTSRPIWTPPATSRAGAAISSATAIPPDPGGVRSRPCSRRRCWPSPSRSSRASTRRWRPAAAPRATACPSTASRH
ncbi:molybdopterin cofactor-binding domain-containing protein [Paeniroseomonas aquatica]|uniref:molybdopterin cofactor-binding domain-containing protein n=1 Tax=Paeniroseomonas aquatica TaxID=373043 RepID=UPI0036184F78